MVRSTLGAMVLAHAGLLIPVGSGLADEIVQEGSLSGGKGTSTEEVVLARFDTQGGTMELSAVRIEVLTAVIGGGMADGSGTPVHVTASLAVEYVLDREPLVATEAEIDFVVPNTTPNSFTLFDNDTAEVLIEDPAALAPWIGDGTISLDAISTFAVSEDPPGVVNFGAGGSASYTVTYLCEPAAPPGDVDRDGDVDVDDLVAVLLAWGACPVHDACPADVDDNGVVDVDDLVLVILGWSAP